jgi:type I restriction enzyme S subunit
MLKNSVSLRDITYVPIDVFPSIKNYRIFKEDIYISVAGTLGLVGRIPDILDGANLTENANKITNIQCDIDYLLFVLKSDLIQKTIVAEMTLGAQPKLALTRIRNFDIPLPSIDEQIKIAQILSDMDTEIEALEMKLDKYRLIKQGMMQELLTGRIRLIHN